MKIIKVPNKMEMRNHHPISYFALLGLSYLVLLATSYALGYIRGSSLRARHLSMSMVAPELVRQTIIDRVYKGTSLYEGSYGNIYERLIQKIQPKTIIKLNGCGSATYLANLTSQIGCKAQILCDGDFYGRPGYRDLFVKNVVLENASGSILPMRISSASGLGILGDIVEVDVGRDFYSAWSNIHRAYKLSRPGGVIFGHNNGFRQEVKLFARVKKLWVTVEGEHWIMYRP